MPFEQAEMFHEALTKAGVDVTLVKILGGSHAIGGDEVLQRVKAFFEKHLRGQNVKVSDEPIEAGESRAKTAAGSNMMIPSTRAKFCFVASLLLLSLPAAAADSGAPYQATGFKVGEVTDSSAIVWTRLTLHAQHNPSDGPMVKIEYDGGKKSRGQAGRAKPRRPCIPPA